jgi:hypothetical protein
MQAPDTPPQLASFLKGHKDTAALSESRVFKATRQSIGIGLGHLPAKMGLQGLPHEVHQGSALDFSQCFG